MESNLRLKINRLNELYSRSESGNSLTNEELTEQAILRDEIINILKNIIHDSKFN